MTDNSIPVRQPTEFNAMTADISGEVKNKIGLLLDLAALSQTMLVIVTIVVVGALVFYDVSPVPLLKLKMLGCVLLLVACWSAFSTWILTLSISKLIGRK